MCGIAGAYDGTAWDVDAMVDCLAHRGPDDAGRYSNGVELGMSRLSIIDLEGGQQPISNEDGSVWVVFNGEIYNYREHKEKLESASDPTYDDVHSFTTDSDTEVLVHLYEEEGEEFVDALNGMFAFALWDVDEEKLLLYRDRIGIKPLYYTDDETVGFASEPQALIRGGLTPKPDKTALSYFWHLDYIPAPHSAFQGVKQVNPGEMVRVTGDGTERTRYWSSRQSLSTAPEDDMVRRVDEALETSVRRRLTADVPVGAFLSGGLDSSTIVSMMSNVSPDPVQTYSITFEDTKHDEGEHSRFVADHFGTDHHEYQVSLDDAEIVPEVLQQYGEPLSDPALIPTNILSERAAENVKVVCTGEGADELFGGYDRYPLDMKYWELFKNIPGPAKWAARQAHRVVPEKTTPARYLEYVGAMTSQTDAFVGTRLREPTSMLAMSDTSDVPALVAERFRDDDDYLRNMIQFDTDIWLPGELLAKVDRTTMANSLEARVPFLDHELVELALKIPSEYKVKGGTQKHILRRVAHDRLPREIHDRPKDAFTVPIGSWMRNRDSPLRSHFQPHELRRVDDILDAERVHENYQKFCDGNDRYKRLMWKVLTLKIWYENHVEPHR